ncbi:MAG: aldehyde dehydrogenase family protein [Rhodothermales bacterium]
MRPQRVKTPITHFGTSGHIHYEPKGTGLIFSAWNYPILLALGPLVSAIAAGCTAILKPSEQAPASSAWLAALIADCFSPEEVAVVEGDAEVAQHLTALPFDHLLFTGSPGVGKLVMRAAAEHLTSVTLELGGKSPCIVTTSANLDAAARKIAFGKFTNAGQTCICPDYLLVDRTIADDFVRRLSHAIGTVYGSTPTARQTTDGYARIIHERHFDRLLALLTDATEAGAHLAFGGQHDRDQLYLAPTLLTDVPLDSNLMQEEIFGPLMPILTYDTLDDALALINSRPKPLAFYIFTDDDAEADRVVHHTTAGSTVINDTLLHFAHTELPFGGVGTSGMGKAHGHHGFLAFSNERAVLKQQWAHPLYHRLGPPITDQAKQLLRATLRLLRR